MINNSLTGSFCSGDLIFEDTFDTFDLRKWQHENTLAGGGVSKQFLYLIPIEIFVMIVLKSVYPNFF